MKLAKFKFAKNNQVFVQPGTFWRSDRQRIEILHPKGVRCSLIWEGWGSRKIALIAVEGAFVGSFLCRAKALHVLCSLIKFPDAVFYGKATTGEVFLCKCFPPPRFFSPFLFLGRVGSDSPEQLLVVHTR